jgi:hypothetical protein
VRALSDFTVAPAPESGDKLTRFGPFSSQCRAGNVKIRRGLWNEELFRVLEGFPDLAHDDEVDACSGALEILNAQMNASANPDADTRETAEHFCRRRARNWVDRESDQGFESCFLRHPARLRGKPRDCHRKPRSSSGFARRRGGFGFQRKSSANPR